MRNVLQGKGATWNECDIKECSMKNAQCEEKQWEKRAPREE